MGKVASGATGKAASAGSSTYPVKTHVRYEAQRLERPCVDGICLLCRVIPYIVRRKLLFAWALYSGWTGLRGVDITRDRTNGCIFNGRGLTSPVTGRINGKTGLTRTG
jgi:hypothetical protein